MKMMQTLSLIFFFVSAMAFAETKRSPFQTPYTIVEGADKVLDTQDKDLTIEAGRTALKPTPSISSGVTLTVDGTLLTTDVISGAGTLVGSGTVARVDEQSVFTPNKTFGNDVIIQGNLDVSGSLSNLLESGDPTLSITGLNNATGGTMLFDKYSRVDNVVNFSFATTMNPTATRWDFTLDSFPFVIASGQGSCSGVGSAQTGSNHSVCTVVDQSTTTAKVWCDDTSDNADPDNQTIYFIFQCQIQ